MGKRKPQPRTEQRALSRAHAALVNDLEVLASRKAGGSAARPIDIESAAQVEPLAGQGDCPLCEGPLALMEHAAETHDGVRLRVARLRCGRCGVRRARYFRLRGPTLN